MDEEMTAQEREDEPISQEDKPNGKVIEWLRNHYWLIAIVSGIIALVGLFGPIVSGKAFTGEFVDGWWAFERTGADRAGVFLNGLFSPFNWTALLPYMLLVVGIVISCVSFKRHDLYIIATFFYIVSGIFFLFGKHLYNLGLSLYYNSLNPVEGGASSLIEDIASTFSTKLSFGYTFSAILSFVAALINFNAATQKEAMNIRDLTEVAIFSAVAIGLQFIKIPIGVTGGSVNLGIVPLFMIALRHGPIKGFIAGGLVYGLITCILDGYGLFTYPFDYLIGFGSVAILGYFRKFIFLKPGGKRTLVPVSGFIWIALGVTLGTAVRFIGSTLSSIVNYGYPFGAALAYNSIYIPVTGAIALGITEALYVPLAILNRRFPAK